MMATSDPPPSRPRSLLRLGNARPTVPARARIGTPLPFRTQAKATQVPPQAPAQCVSAPPAMCTVVAGVAGTTGTARGAEIAAIGIEIGREKGKESGTERGGAIIETGTQTEGETETTGTGTMTGTERGTRSASGQGRRSAAAAEGGRARARRGAHIEMTRTAKEGEEMRVMCSGRRPLCVTIRASLCALRMEMPVASSSTTGTGGVETRA
mmetsp:Transcript_3175/g.8405  ORF Transcript_3175/g.8405 Transcript_3175/m.8405 type:complete len:211 (+) Transcript_3175:1041-1673(+)